MKIALTDKSYKNYYENKKHEKFKDQVNANLATFGDSILKMVLCKILYQEDVEKLTEEKKKYESDEVLVNKIAKYYNIIDKIRYDKKDTNIPKDYEYDSKHKYIATAIEACIGAIYLDENSFESIEKIVKAWKKYIDESKS